jgi:hypothetical protein
MRERIWPTFEKTLQAIRERDGVKYFSEVGGNLIETIAFNVSYHAGSKAFAP